MRSTVETKIIELVKLGHELASELKASCGAVDVRSVAQLISDLATQLEVQFARSNALAAKLSMINGLMDAAEQANKLAQEATEKLVQERDALAAENAHMQQVIGEVQILYYESDGIVGYHLNGEVAKWDDVMPDLWAETPATDAFLAEVRASCVDAVKQKISDAISGCYQDEMAGLDAAVNIASEFAAQLRKGVQS
ncbi:TPA: hypothetical protein ND514_001017 [Citrobacter koseri]|uniref:hypothetical protein n=1 Tax=Citrobacter TaxID=544 RepID=UPI0025778106|nr:hypothetical protein [Citrobacter sp. CK190]MDM2989506.1 hypothetical protein [Citrobacter sp. CK190]HCD7727816.1 hypothetical protein [Citrobacter koseri]